MPKIDMQTIVSTFEGHTIFSIFQEHIAVYEQILEQMQEHEFLNEKDFNGNVVENSYLRRIYRILLIPTADWIDSKDVRRRLEKQALRSANRDSLFNWAKRKLGVGDGIKKEGQVGFKSIRQKSLHF